MVQAIHRATLRAMEHPLRRFIAEQPARNVRSALPTILWIVMVMMLSACDRNIEPYQPGEEPSAPDLAHIFPGATAEGGSGQPDRTALPPSRAEAQAGPSSPGSSGSGPIVGRIELPSELANARPAGGVLFVIARSQGGRGGPPLAVLRISDPAFPLDFSIGPENVMIPSMRFEGPISLSARLDADGNAMTRSEEDLSSPVQEALSPGTTGVELRLSERG
jgi:cytochrome c-type biogenesis protein CcmH